MQHRFEITGVDVDDRGRPLVDAAGRSVRGTTVLLRNGETHQPRVGYHVVPMDSDDSPMCELLLLGACWSRREAYAGRVTVPVSLVPRCLWESLTSGYRFAVNRTYLNGLDTDLSQRLYSYLAKKDYRSRFYEESVIKVGRRLGIAKTSPSDIRSSLEPACEVLRRPSGPEGKVFLRSFAFEGVRSAMKLVVETNREVDADREAAAGAVRGREVIEELAKRFAAKPRESAQPGALPT